MSSIHQDIKPLFESALKTLEFILEHKDEISQIGPKEPTYYGIFEIFDKKICVFNGLCDNISAGFYDALEIHPGDPRSTIFHSITEAWATTWPNFSGETAYPVPMPEYFSLDWEPYSDHDLSMDYQTEETKAYAAFHTCDDERYNMYADNYGQLRLQLAEFWVGKLKEKIHEINKPENNLEQQQ